MAEPNYKEQLTDPRWQRKRLEVLQRADFTCEECGAKDQTLHVHHRYYVSHRMLWEYPDFCYQCLCKNCHENIRLRTIESRETGESMNEDWEAGLNYFRDKIFNMYVDDATAEDFKIAHALM